MKVMLFAAGLGTRLRPLTDHLPKALVEVAGRPMIDHVIDHLVAEGATEIVVNVHHFADLLIDHLKGRDWGVPVGISDERDGLLDTGGGLKRAAGLFTQNDDPILVHNVDVLSAASLRDFYRQGKALDVSLMVSERKTSRYLLFAPETLRLIGWTNVKTGEVRSPYDEATLARCRRYAFSGIHLISPRAIALMDECPDAFPIVPFYVDYSRRLDIRAAVTEHSDLIDIGKPETLALAADWLKRHGWS